VKPCPQSNWHWPALQLGEAFAGAEQTRPHAPQFEVSAWSSTHCCPHFVFVPAQVSEQAPSEHT